MINGLEKFNNSPVKVSGRNIKSSNVSFSGSNTKLINELVRTEVTQNKFAKFFFNVKEKANENFNILVNALGTAIVAPIFIAFNPISKEDKDTKTYSALRQPISAVLAVITQIGINTKVNNYLDKLACQDKLGTMFDLSSEPLDNVIIRAHKKELRGKTKEEIETFVRKIQDDAKRIHIVNAEKKLRKQGYKVDDLAKAAMESVDKKIKLNKESLKNFKTFTGMFVTLAIMPFTCWALNWIYPRFMETFFPSISKSKKGGNKKC